MLKEIMKKRGISQAGMARKAGINQTQLNRAINGYQPFFKGWKERISKVLDMPVDELFPEEKKEV
jgi:transcriptional regulator with XRE-family HTH domain